TSLKSPSAIAFDSKGNAYVADTGNNRVLKYDKDAISPKTGKLNPLGSFAGVAALAVIGQGGSLTSNSAGVGPDALKSPSGVAVDSKGNLYVADTGNHRVLMFPNGASPATGVIGQADLTTGTL